MQHTFCRLSCHQQRHTRGNSIASIDACACHVLLQLADEALALYNACVRETLSACGGYESKEVAGMFMAAFQGPAAALEWALALQLALLKVPWPRLLLECPAAAVMKGCEQQAQVS